jgi:hypothetical protein
MIGRVAAWELALTHDDLYSKINGWGQVIGVRRGVRRERV